MGDGREERPVLGDTSRLRELSHLVIVVSGSNRCRKILGPERCKFYDPCASALKAGLRISIHSDYNVTPIGPLRCVQDAVTRVMKDGGEVFVPEERIPAADALRAVTLDAAWQCRMDDICGSLEPGKYADLALLEEDPTAVDPMTIENIKVSETWLAGTPRHGA